MRRLLTPISSKKGMFGKRAVNTVWYWNCFFSLPVLLKSLTFLSLRLFLTVFFFQKYQLVPKRLPMVNDLFLLVILVFARLFVFVYWLYLCIDYMYLSSLSVEYDRPYHGGIKLLEWKLFLQMKSLYNYITEIPVWINPQLLSISVRTSFLLCSNSIPP